jgi:L-asparaginase II
VRDGTTESVHRGSVVVADSAGRVLAALGDAQLPTYVRSAAKPFQALATLALLDRVGVELDGPGLAIACASHEGSDTHQIEAAQLLAMAGLDESALLCPPSLPMDLATLLDQREPEALAHNCSGKHAAFLLATVAAGEDPARYLDPESAVQRAVRDALATALGAPPEGPGVDGCGAPAWRLPLSALAVGFARLAAGSHGLEPVRRAMRRHPDLVGGAKADDTALMQADPDVIAKRGAEAVFAAGLIAQGRGMVGVAVKIEDGGQRASAPVVAAVLEALGARVPKALRHRPVMGGGRPRGEIEVEEAVVALPLASVNLVSNDS